MEPLKGLEAYVDDAVNVFKDRTDERHNQSVDMGN